MHNAEGSKVPQPPPLFRSNLVALVVDLDDRHVGRAHFVEHAAHRGDPPIAIRRRRIDDVENQIGLGDLLERGAKCRHERVGQPVDESDRVGDEELAAVGQLDLPDERVERHEQGVGGVGVGARERIEERRLAGIGVTDQRHGRAPRSSGGARAAAPGAAGPARCPR